MFKIAIIGVGRWGANHARVLNKLSKDYDLDVIVVDKNLERAKSIAEKFGYSFYEDYMKAWEREKFDASIIAVPTYLHYKVVKDLLPLTDVFVEKPFTVNLNEARELVKIARKEKRIVQVGHIERFNPVIMALKEELNKRLEKGERLLNLAAERIGVKPEKIQTYLGVTHDLLVHDMDVAFYLLGVLPVKVWAQALWGEEKYEDEVNTIFAFPKDKIGIFVASRRALMKRRTLRIQLSQSMLLVDYILQTLTVMEGVHPTRPPLDYLGVLASYQAVHYYEKRTLRGEENEPLLLEDKHFIETVKHGKTPLVNEVDGYISIKCIEAVLKSAREGVPVELTWEEDFVCEKYPTCR